MDDPDFRARPTLKDVARLAGVSIASASYSLHNRGSVGEATRQRVREAAETLGYRPNVIAQAMKTGRSGTSAIRCFLPLPSPWCMPRVNRAIGS